MYKTAAARVHAAALRCMTCGLAGRTAWLRHSRRRLNAGIARKELPDTLGFLSCLGHNLLPASAWTILISISYQRALSFERCDAHDQQRIGIAQLSSAIEKRSVKSGGIGKQTIFAPR